MTSPHPPATYASVLRNREFAAMFCALGLSVLGDMLARIAVALLVYERSGSALAASATYACAYLPYLLAGPVLATLADRYPRRRMMIITDLLRMLLVAALALPGVSLWVVFPVLIVTTLLSSPFDAARSALLADVVTGDAYVKASALSVTLSQAGQVVGFALGGALVALVGVREALALDALTFAASAALLLRVAERPLSRTGTRAPLLRDTAAGAALVWRSQRLRALLGWGLLSVTVIIAPEGLAVAVAVELGRGAVAAGLLTAAVPLGFVVGSFLIARVPTARREALFTPALVLSIGALLATPLLDQATAVFALWVLAGVGSAVNLISNASFVQAVPAEARGRAFGIAGTALMAVQGTVLLVSGALGDVVSPRTAVALLALLGLLLLPGMVLLNRKAQSSTEPVEICRVPAV